MNCKPNDLAYIAVPGPHHGKIVRVLSLDPKWGRYGAHWFYEGNIPCELLGGERYVSLRDEFLRPIGNPGDDAADQFARKREAAE